MTTGFAMRIDPRRSTSPRSARPSMGQQGVCTPWIARWATRCVQRGRGHERRRARASTERRTKACARATARCVAGGGVLGPGTAAVAEPKCGSVRHFTRSISRGVSGPTASSAQVERRILPNEERICDPGLPTILEPIRYRPLTRETPCPAGTPAGVIGCMASEGLDGVDCDGIEGCVLAVEDFAVADDQSLWIAASVTGSQPAGADHGPGRVDAIWIAHENADGSQRGARIVVRKLFDDPDVVVDGRGHAFVLVRRESGPRGWLSTM
jgi:hypothetical protein